MPFFSMQFTTTNLQPAMTPSNKSCHKRWHHYSNSCILDGWASYFESVSQPSELPFNLYHLDTLEVFCELHELAKSSDPDPDPITTDINNQVTLRKAAGLVQLINEHTMYDDPILPSILATIFLSGCVPSAFCHGLIIPIPKGPNI